MNLSKLKFKGKTCKEYSLQQLKEMLKKEKLKVSGTKEELCVRLKEYYRVKRQAKASIVKPPKKVKKVKELKKPDPKNSTFKFYASTYYQMKGSQMAKKELGKYGMEPHYLDSFASYQELYKNLLKGE
tara:strand:- start:240 stop:623 length:384 start_codon:yes stop_codon:yes gene_type:complete